MLQAVVIFIIKIITCNRVLACLRHAYWAMPYDIKKILLNRKYSYEWRPLPIFMNTTCVKYRISASNNRNGKSRHFATRWYLQRVLCCSGWKTMVKLLLVLLSQAAALQEKLEQKKCSRGGDTSPAFFQMLWHLCALTNAWAPQHEDH